MEWRDKLTCKIFDLSDDKVSVEILLNGEYSLGILYYENPKVGWTNKPIMSDRWRCVDAKVERLYVYGGESLTPKDLMVWAQQQVLLHKTKKNANDSKEQEPSNGDGYDEVDDIIEDLPNLRDGVPNNLPEHTQGDES